MNGKEADLIAAIRQRPAMYVGRTSFRGFVELLRGIIAFTFDVLNADSFSLELSSGLSGTISISQIKVTVEDNIVINPSPTPGAMSESIWFAALNALSTSFLFTLFDAGERILTELQFGKGTLERGEVQSKNFSVDSLTINFTLDNSILQIHEPLNGLFFLNEARALSFLYNNRSLRVAYPVNGETCKSIFKVNRGLLELVTLESLKGLGGAQFLTHEIAEFESCFVEYAFGFREYSVDPPFLISFVNARESVEGGEHVTALIRGIQDALVRFAGRSMLTDDLSVHERGIRKQLIAAVHVRMDRPHFEGSVRNKLISPEVKDPLFGHVSTNLTRQLYTNPTAAADLLKVLSRRSREFPRNQ